MTKIRNAVAKVVRAINYVAMAACFLCVFVVSIDVILRKVSGQRLSISGSNEMSQFLLLVMCMLSIPMLQIKKGHVWVSMFVEKLPVKLRSIWLGVILLIETLVCVAFVVGCIQYGSAVAVRTSDLLHLPWRPFAYVCAFGFLEFAVLLAIDTIQSFQGARGGDGKKAAAE
jgi:TRAP-type C4-dicarboxylate transport system permease small subunit